MGISDPKIRVFFFLTGCKVFLYRTVNFMFSPSSSWSQNLVNINRIYSCFFPDVGNISTVFKM